MGSLNGLGLGFIFTAQDLASSTMHKVLGSYKELENGTAEGAKRIMSSMKQMAAGFALAAAGASALFAADKLAGVAANFEQTLAGVQVKTRATAADMSSLRDAAIQAGIATQYSPLEAVKAMQMLAIRTNDVKQSMQLLLPVLDLAASSLGTLSPEGAAGLAMQVMKGFSIETSKTTLTIDKMVRAGSLLGIQLDELPQGLGNASHASRTLNQSFDETLTTLGIMRQQLPSIEQAGTAASVAMAKLADPKVMMNMQSLVRGGLFSSPGKFRPFLDIINDLIPRLQQMTAAQRASFLEQNFGIEGMTGVTAIMGVLTQGIRTQTGETLKGAAALKYYREQLALAGGEAQKTRDALLNTLKGQQTLLHGSLETLMIELGEPLAQALRPVTEAFLKFINLVIGFVNGMPAGLKLFIARVFLLGASFVTVVGAVIALKAAFAILGVLLAPVLAAIGGIVAALIPFLPLIAAIALVVAALKVAWDNNFGGIRDSVARTWDTIKLFFEAIGQVFSNGGISGPVRDELNKAENLGLRTFVGKVFAFVARIKLFFAGIAEGFEAAVVRMKDIWITMGKVFGVAIAIFKSAFGFILSMFDQTSSKASVFETLGKVFGWIAGVLADVLGGALIIVGVALVVVAGVFRGVWYVVEGVGIAIGWLASFIVDLFTVYIPDAASFLWNKLKSFGTALKDFFVNSIPNAIKAAALSVGQFVAHLVAKIPASIRPAFLDDLAAVGGASDSAATATGLSPALPATSSPQSLQVAAAVAGASSANPAVAQSQAAAAQQSVNASMMSEAVVKALKDQNDKPVIVSAQLSVDSETIATATLRGQRSNDQRSFSPANYSE